MVLLLSKRNTPNKRFKGRNPYAQLIAALTLKGVPTQYDLTLFFKQKGLHRHLKRRLWDILHYIVTPNLNETELQQLLVEITSHNYFPTQLWSFIGTWDEPRDRLAEYIEQKNMTCLFNCLHDGNRAMWCFVNQKEYYNIAHEAINRDLLDVTILLCRSTDPRGRIGLNQCNFYDETPAHMAARLLKVTHLRQLVNCAWVDLTTTDALGRTCVQTLLNGLLHASSRVGKSMLDVVSILSDALARCHRLSGHRDHSGWSIADYAMCLGNIGMISVAIKPAISPDSVFKSHTDFLSYLTALLKHAILYNDPGRISCIYPYFLKHVIGIDSTETIDLVEKDGSGVSDKLNIYSIIDVFNFIVDHKTLKSLVYMCSLKETALILRRLGCLGWAPLSRAVLSAGPTTCLGDYFITTLLNYCPNGSYATSGSNIVEAHVLYNAFDNVFSLASYFGNVETVRSLLLHSGSVRVVKKRKTLNGSPCYFFDRYIFSSNPLVSAVKGRNSLGRRNGALNSEKVAREPFLDVIKYLLIQTPFSELKNMPEKFGCFEDIPSTITNPLAEACKERDLRCIQLFCSLGCDPLHCIPALDTGG